MKLSGLQKLTLLDYPEKTACTLFTPGCNFRCPFCQNGGLVLPDEAVPEIPLAEFFAFLSKRSGLLDGICISGGEPLMQHGIEAFCEKVKKLGFSIKLDTNGSYPARLRQLADGGLIDYVAMDIKNSRERYAETAGVPGLTLDALQESIDFLMNGSLPYEFRTTVVRELHTQDDILSLSKWIAGANQYYLQAFQDNGSVIKPGLHAYSAEEMEALRALAAQHVPSVKLRGI